ncbi:MAG: hypothetical protein ACI9H6_000375 [Patiriisocius sp.]|jgi:hypothetical protein
MKVFTTRHVLYTAILFVATMIVVVLYNWYMMTVVQPALPPPAVEPTADTSLPETAEERLELFESIAGDVADTTEQERREVIMQMQSGVDAVDEVTPEERMDLFQDISN